MIRSSYMFHADFYDSYYVMGSKKDKGCAAPPIRDYMYLSLIFFLYIAFFYIERRVYIYQTNLFVFPKDRYCYMLESKQRDQVDRAGVLSSYLILVDLFDDA